MDSQDFDQSKKVKGKDGGYRSSGFFGKSGSNSAALSSKGDNQIEVPRSLGDRGCFSSHSPSVLNNGTSHNNRSLGKNQSRDPRIFPASAMTSVTASSHGTDSLVTTSSSIRDNGQHVANKFDGSFVPYLPQDDAVMAGLGEREGGVDVADTQEVADLLNQQLSNLLCLPPRQFWKKVISDESLFLFLDSYLHFRRRWFDNPFGSDGGEKVGLVAGDGDLSRRVFMTLFRMSSNHDPGAPASESLSAKEHSAILQEKRVLDVPKLMDICAIYGRDNSELTSRLVTNVFKSHPNFAKEVAADVPPLLKTIMSMHQRCSDSLKAADVGINSRELGEVVDYLMDVTLTLSAFVEAYPGAATILITPNQGLFLPVLATVHDTLLPVLEKCFSGPSGPATLQLYDFVPVKSLNLRSEHSDHIANTARLSNLRSRLVDFTWQLIHYCYLSGSTSQETVFSGIPESLGSKGDILNHSSCLVQALVALANGSSIDDENIPYVGSLSCTGALLVNMERRYGLYNQLQVLCQKGLLILDDAQLDYVAALIGYDNIKDTSPNKIQALPGSQGASLDGRHSDEEAVIQQSKISQIKDLFPNYGDGFIAACLEVYDNDPEKVIERILEGTLHQDLLALDITLPIKPTVMMPAKSEKGKGKLTDQPAPGKGKGVWENNMPRKDASTSSVAVLGNSVGSSGGPVVGFNSVPDLSKAGRYVRRQKDDTNFNEILDSKNRGEEVRAAVKAAAAQLEYEDEYDDSFDELDRYVADSGGVAEAESLADMITHNGNAMEATSSIRGKSPALTPWGSSHSRGRGVSGSAPRAKAELSKPPAAFLQSEELAQETQGASIQSQGNGGRGRGKWKERAPKSPLYLKDGKIYSYKVAGGVGVASVEEAELLKKTEEDTIYGLGKGGNFAAKPQDTVSGKAYKDNKDEDSSKTVLGSPGAEAGRSRGGGSGRGRGSYPFHARKDTENHNRKDRAMKKHFDGLGGF